MMCKNGIHYWTDPGKNSFCMCLLWSKKEFRRLKCEGKIASHMRNLWNHSAKERMMAWKAKPVVQIKDGEPIAVFRGLREAMYVTGIDSRRISDFLSGRMKSKDYKWEFA